MYVTLKSTQQFSVLEVKTILTVYGSDLEFSVLVISLLRLSILIFFSDSIHKK